ncbi:aldehyde dehydrogenase [Candidatus Enterococcus ferrettii]|uniref:Aldehyde dehydrogenase n=1 Tax=Candidatus Enterococcus ferrettii TaxID=2815324 RepID=A0ABV0EVN1_9ENTE|nr:aldehyde dehydrogenase [Enterococcus sp. 665A]MBO1342358.1 aldehyde dehydrogenase [Enterococcus sp. 665A]
MAKEWTKQEAKQLLEQHQQFFATHQTKDPNFRVAQLKNLRQSIVDYEKQLMEALQQDLGKHPLESYATEIGFVLKSLSSMIKKVPKWAKDQRVSTPFFLWPSSSRIHYEPYGTVLVIGPFNYPFQLLIEPLVGALAAGNCAVIKPSELTPNFSRVVSDMIKNTFDSKYVSVVEGGVDTNNALLSCPFDYIFFTGSEKVGKIVMQAAAEHLTPITLELGGKSPAIVTENADVRLAAKRIIWGKTINAGQTCVAPDYVVVHQQVKNAFIQEVRNVLEEFYGTRIEKSDSYARIVNEKHFIRLADLMEETQDEWLFGGEMNPDDLYIEPTLLEASWKSAAMEEEIFGPILPVISYTNLDTTISEINKMAKPLAMYIFSQNKQQQDKIINETSSGGLCINNTVMHLVSDNMPFGGVGSAGIGSYHGKYSFETFSNARSILSSKKLDTPFIFPPYTEKNLAWIRRILK